MGERKGQNKYYPPDFDPAKHKSLDAYHGTHPLRERAKKLKSQGILIIRFEMPYNIWCGGCKNHIGMGVRYNAEKSKVGNYYSTPIYKFRMKCHLCDNYMEIQTDPANCEYVILSGARRKEQRWDPGENEQIVTEDRNVIKKLVNDPMYKLEHGDKDKVKQKAALPALGQIAAIQEQYKDDYMLNKLARNKFRNEKKSLASKELIDKALLSKSSLDIKLVEETEEDKKLASLIKYSTVKSYDEKQHEKRKSINSKPIFGSPIAKSTDKDTQRLFNTKTKLEQTIKANKNVDPFSVKQKTVLGNLVKKKTPQKLECAVNDDEDAITDVDTADGKRDSENVEDGRLKEKISEPIGWDIAKPTSTTRHELLNKQEIKISNTISQLIDYSDSSDSSSELHESDGNG